MEILDFPFQIIDEVILQGEFPSVITSASAKVAVVMTQSWCPQYTMMRKWLNQELLSELRPELKVYILKYDGQPWFDRFLDFKENKFKNALIPYVRYYVNGEYKGDSNYVSPDIFYNRLEK